MMLTFTEIKLKSAGREMEFVRQHVSAEYLTNKQGPCPTCGGKTKYRLMPNKPAGTFYCNDHGQGDFIDNVSHCTGMDARETLKALKDFLGIEQMHSADRKALRERSLKAQENQRIEIAAKNELLRQDSYILDCIFNLETAIKQRSAAGKTERSAEEKIQAARVLGCLEENYPELFKERP